jgi:hypothetical protein
VAQKIGELSTKGGIYCRGKGGLKFGGKRNIRKSDALGYEVSAGGKMLFEYGESRGDAFLEDSVDLERDLRGGEYSRNEDISQAYCKAGSYPLQVEV